MHDALTNKKTYEHLINRIFPDTTPFHNILGMMTLQKLHGIKM
jgi:hypothetical protein